MDYCEGNHEGMMTLKNRIDEIKPLYHIFGHTHEGYGVQKIDNTIRINCSTCNAEYEPVNKPIEFRLKKKNK
jgi:Icc-related predicted phosphoesterase